MTKNFSLEKPQAAVLSGRLEMPVGRPRAAAIVAHCFAYSGNPQAAKRVSRVLVERGYIVLLFDISGLGSEFAETTFCANLVELVTAAEALGAEGYEPQLLVGHSLGGAAVLAVAHLLPSVRAIATIGAPFEPAHAEHLLGTRFEQLKEDDTGGEPGGHLGSQDFLEDLRAQPQHTAIGELGRPLLILHSPTDSIVGFDNARQIYEAALQPKNLISIDGANHLLTSIDDANFVADLLSTWAARYVKAQE